VGLAVREKPVDDHADNGEDEDDETPEELVGGRAVRLQDLDCGTRIELAFVPALTGRVTKEGEDDALKTMMSRTRTTNPMMPPPVPYCQASVVVAETSPARGAAKAKVARQSWKKIVARAFWNILTGDLP
jgi:hypothetical protein